MANILKGSEVVEKLNLDIEKRVEKLKESGIKPCLAMIRVGNKQDAISYEKGASKRCEKLGVESKVFELAEDVTQEELLNQIDILNKDDSIHGILLFRPLPKHLNDKEACQKILPKKDVDGITDTSIAAVFKGEKDGYPPCTAEACIAILDHFGIDCKGKKAVVIGRSMVVGRPAAMMLLSKNATTTICHTKTENMEEICRRADILIVAVGKAKMITKEYLNKNQIVIDVGINVDNQGKLCGDVDFEDAEKQVQAITPVPGGVGSVTTSILVLHVVEAAEKQKSKGAK